MKDFMAVSFKGRIAAPPTFGTTKNGKKYASFKVAVNKDYKNNGAAVFVYVSYFGRCAEYVKRGFNSGKTFQVGCTVFVSDAELNLEPLPSQMSFQTNALAPWASEEEEWKRSRNMVSFINAKSENTFCSEKTSSADTGATEQKTTPQNPASWGNAQAYAYVQPGNAYVQPGIMGYAPHIQAPAYPQSNEQGVTPPYMGPIEAY